MAAVASVELQVPKSRGQYLAFIHIYVLLNRQAPAEADFQRFFRVTAPSVHSMIFFEYTARETSAAVGTMFHGFSGYVQADAKSVYDFLFRPPEERARSHGDQPEPDGAVRHEVGCWSHLRTKAWEVAITSKHPIAREMLARIMRMFALDRGWKKLPIPRSRRSASRTFAPTSTRSSRSSRPSTSASRISADCSDRPSATPFASAAR